MQFVIIGGGIAGTTCAQELRKLNADAQITILEQEPHRLYSKVLLARYVTGELERERLFLKTEDWYTANNIELITEIRVESIDTINKHVAISDGREIPYDKLLIASGQEPRLVKDNLPGIVYFRSLDDAETLKALINKLNTKPAEERRMIIVGGSFISMEFLHICQKLQIPATVVLRSGGFWSKVLSDESQAIVLNKARALGAQIYTNSDFSLLESKEFSGIKLSDGTEIRGAILAVGIGLESDLSWVSDCGLEADKGIVCDSHLQTSDLNIFTAGDIAQFDDIICERKHQIVNWTNAIEQGRATASAMAGDSQEFKFVSSYATRIGDLELTFIGDTGRPEADNIARVEKDGAVIELFERNKKTVGAVILGSAKERTTITKAITNKTLYNI
ncbi:FAD-dependent oxidoreductase [Patescibacteria group bacterium]|nr:FAD-dependent oxidoreductase [Patescibacteria group bacterium]